MAVSNECNDGTHRCVDGATCLQSVKSSGYLCRCGSGSLGNGFEEDIGTFINKDNLVNKFQAETAAAKHAMCSQSNV